MRALSPTLSPILTASTLLSSGCLLNYYVGDFDTGRPPVNLVKIDLDSDSYSEEEGDCDDNDPQRSPGHADDCDGIDNDCDDLVDQNIIGGHTCDTEESFNQLMLVDVLIVVDPSASMSPYWLRASTGAISMLEHLVGKAGREAHIGVITTEMSTDPEAETGGGRLVEAKDNIRFLTGNEGYAEASVWLGQAIAPTEPLGIDVAEGVRSAIEASITEHSEGWNAGFFRPGADLAIVIFSNTDDLSEPNNQAFLTGLQSYIGPIGPAARIYTIAPKGDDSIEPTTCAGLPAAVRLLALAERSSAMSLDLCEADYTGFMSDVGEDIAEQAVEDTFTLANPAIPDSVAIFISDAEVSPKYPWVGPYTLSADGREIVFSDPLPPAGSFITIEYRIAL